MKSYKSVFILAIVLLISVSCQKGSTADISKGSYSKNYDCEIGITLSTDADQSFVFGGDWKNRVISWQKEIEEKYGIKVNLKYVSSINFATFMDGTYLEEEIGNNGLAGLIALNYYEISNIGNLAEKELIIPLDEYLADNRAFQSIPDYILKPYMIDGHLYALPTGNSNFPSVRLISKQMLTETGSKVPETLSEYFEVMQKFSKLKDTVPMVMNYYNNNITPMVHNPQMNFESNGSILNLKDLFYANGCYPSYTGYISYNYDPLTGGVEDFMLKPGAEETLTYINSLFQSNLLQVEKIYNIETFAQNKNFGSYYQCIQNYKPEYQNDYEIIWYLKGNNDKYLNAVEPSKMVYVLSKNTENPKETINAYVDAFFLNKDGYYMMYMGKESDTYSYDGKSITLKDNNNIMRLVDTNVEFLTENAQVFRNADGLEYFQDMDKIKSVAETLIRDEMLFTSSLYPLSNKTRLVSQTYNWFFDLFINGKGNANVEDIQKNYVNHAKTRGSQETLDFLNELYGTKATYSY